jgi:hypothetical protein
VASAGAHFFGQISLPDRWSSLKSIQSWMQLAFWPAPPGTACTDHNEGFETPVVLVENRERVVTKMMAARMAGAGRDY